MITNGNERMSVGGGFLSVEEFYGLSTDTKPTNTANGSTFFEMDTGKMYRFNYSGATWTETTHYGSDGFGPAPSGGGGGSTGGGVLVVHVDWDVDDGTLDKTWQEIVTFALTGVVALVDIVDGNGTVKMLSSTNINENEYQLSFFGGESEEFYVASSANGYPVYSTE